MDSLENFYLLAIRNSLYFRYQSVIFTSNLIYNGLLYRKSVKKNLFFDEKIFLHLTHQKIIMITDFLLHLSKWIN